MPRTIIWASSLACLFIAISVAIPTFAQGDEDGASQQDSQSDRQSDSDSDEQVQQQSQQDQQQSRQEQQRDQQQYQQEQQNQRQQTSSQQDQQRFRQDQQRTGQSQWDDRDSRDPDRQDQSSSPAWNRDEFRRAPQTGRSWDRPSEDFDRQSPQAGRSEEQGGLGIAIVRDEEGRIRVARVYRNTPADRMGLQPGDRITQVNGQQVQSTQDFISRIRNMNPGEQVELDVLRDREERSVSGELETRQEALVLRNQQMQRQGRGSWQTEFNRGRGGEFYSTQGQTGRSGRGGDVMNRISAIERQLNSLRNELQNLRASVQRGQSGGQFDRTRETAARYDEIPSQREGDIRTSSNQWQDQDRSQQFDSYQDGGQSQQYRGFQDDIRRNQPGADDSPGGETGEDRLRVNSEQINER